MSNSFSEILRVDPLTGCKNYLGFLEKLTNHSLSDLPTDGRAREAVERFEITSNDFFAILLVDMNHIQSLNETKGRTYGDSAIRWMGILLQEECNSEVYRVGGVEFAVLLKNQVYEELLEMAERIVTRIKRESKQLDFPGTAADCVLVFFSHLPTSLDTILMIMGEAMVRIKNSKKAHFMKFNVADFNIPARTPTRWILNTETDISYAVRWVSIINIHQVLNMGRILDATQQEAYTDIISGLPNLKAALLNLEEAIQNASAHKPFSVLLIDGDNIRAYNSINYAAGDEMIRDMCIVFKNNIRPNDFVARWRSGDEFMVILPGTSSEGARIIGERIRLAVKEASKAWRFPVTISIGIASYPTHGDNVNALIDKAEYANKRAKDQGKDQVVLAD